MRREKVLVEENEKKKKKQKKWVKIERKTEKMMEKNK